MTGRLVLVVGPSGVGKDSILRFAMSRFSGDQRFVFPRRCITRVADINTEDHDFVDEKTFNKMSRGGVFALMWGAHGLKYGVPQSIVTDISGGRVVAVNVSRTIVDYVERNFPNAVIAEISASPETRAARIAARGRENYEEALHRVQRQVSIHPSQLVSHVFDNSGKLSEAGDAFCDLLKSLIF